MKAWASAIAQCEQKEAVRGQKPNLPAVLDGDSIMETNPPHPNSCSEKSTLFFPSFQPHTSMRAANHGRS